MPNTITFTGSPLWILVMVMGKDGVMSKEGLLIITLVLWIDKGFVLLVCH